MNRTTGQALDGLEHLRQSIADILTTPIGSRVMRRDYGSLLFELIDQPVNGATRVRIYAATAAALIRWEPRLRLTKVQISPQPEPVKFIVDICGVYKPLAAVPQALQISVPLQFQT